MAATSLIAPLVSLKTRASWDTQQRLRYNPHRTYPKKPSLNPNPISTATIDSTTATLIEPVESITPSILLSRNNQISQKGELGETTYLGYETWLPSPPKVENPRSTYNASQLAYIGDSIYELYARRHFLFPPINIEEYNDRVMAVVRSEAQDAMLQKLLDEKYLSADERNVLRWGKNIGSSKSRTKKRVGAAAYNRASSLETLVGYLYLTDKKRLEEIMLKLGFSCN